MNQTHDGEQWVGLPVPAPLMMRAACDLVRIKDAWDDAVVQRSLRDLVPTAVLNENCSTVDGMRFVLYALPFLDTTQVAECVRAQVPSDRALGTSWRWRNCTGEGGRTPEQVEALLLHSDRSRRSDRDAAHLYYIAPLGLYVALEGKNRVRFLRDRGVSTFPARVALLDYPAAGRIRLYRVALAERETTWAVLDDRWVTHLLLPEVTTRLLLDYGVEPISRWPTHAMPGPEEVSRALAAARESVGSDGRADLNHLREQQKRTLAEEEWVPAAVLDLEGIRVRWWWWLWLTLLSSALVALALFIPILWAATVSGIFAGLVLGAVATCCGRALIVKKRWLAR